MRSMSPGVNLKIREDACCGAAYHSLSSAHGSCPSGWLGSVPDRDAAPFRTSEDLHVCCILARNCSKAESAEHHRPQLHLI